MGSHTFAIFHFSATAGLLIGFVLLLVICLSGPTWRNFSLMTCNLEDRSLFEAVPFSRSRNSYATYGTFGYCIQNIDLGEGYQQRACSDPTIGYPITEIQTAIDGTKFFENNKGLNSLTKVMVLHPVSAITTFLACLSSVRSGYLLSIGSMVMTLTSWMMVTVAMSIEWYIFIIIHEHVNSKEVGGGSTAVFGPALWCLVVAFLLLTFAAVVMTVTVWQRRRFWLFRGGKARAVQNGSNESSPVRRWERDERRAPFWRHRGASRSTSSSSTSRA